MVYLHWVKTNYRRIAMDLRKPVYKNTEAVEHIYSDYEAVKPLAHLEAVYEKDKSNGEYRFDKILARFGAANGDPNRGGNDDGDALMTRGRSLYMFTHDVSVIGFGGDPSYCQPLGRRELMSLDFYIGAEKLEFEELPEKRVNMPSHWHGEYVCGDYKVITDKFISEQNCAVLLYTFVNGSDAPVTMTVSAFSPFAHEPWAVYPGNKLRGELRGRLRDRNDLTTVKARMSASGTSRPSRRRPDGELMPWQKRPTLNKCITVEANASACGNVIIAFTTDEIPEAERDYLRFAELADQSNSLALETQKREYNEYWHQVIPYIDVPSAAMKKAIDYHFWLLRYNTLDANIPGHDYQYPVTIEGVLGYNNAIVLTQCMHLQDTKWQRTPYLPYGQLLSVGSCSGGSAFLDNPGNRRCWNNHYGQYIGTAGREAFYVHGGSKELALTLARWFEGDAKGQLEHYGQHESPSTPKAKLIAYRSNYMTGNDADTCSMHYRGVGPHKAHAENAYVFGAAKSSAELYRLAGNDEKADEMTALAEEIRHDILDYLWCDKCKFFETRAVSPTEDFVVHNPDKPNLVPYKENNNYNYFSEGVAPTDEESLKKYLPAFRHLADPEEFPIFPYYTASQRDNKLAPGSNNFSNINFTVQARAYSAAIRTYDRENVYVTPEMFENMVDWCAWNMYPDGGDVTYPNNSEFFNADHASDPRGKGDYYRSWIYHNILGNYNYIFIEEMAGIRPRADKKIELSPIDFGYSHFAVDNVRYHGADISVFCNLDGHYDTIPKGYSLFINNECVLTLDSLAKVVYDPETGAVETSANVSFSAPASAALPSALECNDADAKTERLFKLAGIETAQNLAADAVVTASFTPSGARDAMWAEKHRADGYDESSIAVNEYAPTADAVVDGKSECMPFWGNFGSPDKFDTLTISLPENRTFDTLVLHFYDDRQKNGYSYPRRYLIEYDNNGEWTAVTTRSQSPRFMCANRNESRFDAVTTDKLRIHVYNRLGHSTAITELALYFEGTERRPVINYAPEVYARSYDMGGLKARLSVDVRDDGMPFDRDLECRWTVDYLPDGVSAVIEDETCHETVMNVSEPGRYHVTLHVTDGEIGRHCSHSILIEKNDAELYDAAPDATVSVDFCSDWENKDGVNNVGFEPRSSAVGSGLGWGTYGSRSDEHFLTLEWNEPVALSSADIYWYCDNGGIKLPSAFSLSYEDADGNSAPVVLTSDANEAIDVNKYNRVTFRTVKAKKLTLHCTAAKSAAVGVYRFKAYMPEISRIEDVTAAIKAGVRPSLPAKVTGISAEGDRILLNVVWFDDKLDTTADGDYSVAGVTSPLTYQVKATVYARGDMDSAGITEVDPVNVTVRAGEAPQLPKYASVHHNNGSADNQTHLIAWNKDALAVRETVGEITVADAGVIEGTDHHLPLTVKII